MQHDHLVCSLLREEDLVAYAGGHCFDVNIIRVKVIQDEHIHVHVAGSGPMREVTGLVREDLTGH